MGFHHPQAHHDFSRPSDAQKLEVPIDPTMAGCFLWGKNTPGAFKRLASRELTNIPWKKGSWDPMIILFHIWYRDMLVPRNIKWRLRLFLSRFRLFQTFPGGLVVMHAVETCFHSFFSKQWKYRCNTSFAVGGIWGLGLVISSMKHQVPRPSIRFVCMCYFQIGFWWVLYHSNMQPYQAVFGFLCRQVSVNRVLAIHFVPNFHVQRRFPDIEIKIPHWVHHVMFENGLERGGTCSPINSRPQVLVIVKGSM